MPTWIFDPRLQKYIWMAVFGLVVVTPTVFFGLGEFFDNLQIQRLRQF